MQKGHGAAYVNPAHAGFPGGWPVPAFMRIMNEAHLLMQCDKYLQHIHCFKTHGS